MSPDSSLDPTRPTPGPGDSDPSDSTLVRTQARTPGADGPIAPGVLHIPGYEITGEIARGGMGAVYAAHDLTLDREVAIKTLLPGKGEPDRFVTEAKITARLPHPAILPVHALGTLRDGSHFLVMKRVHGDTLAQLLKDRESPAADLPRFVQVFEQIAQAVGFAHSRGVIHRDLKPLNVMVGAFGEVQVMDWGLARAGRDEGGGMRDETRAEEVPGSGSSLIPPPSSLQTVAGAVMGTPGYMAPEQARGEPVDARADVFALGAVLTAVLTGQPAFVGTTGRETIAKAAAADLTDVLARLAGCGADADLVALAQRCLAANAADRPADARAVAAEVAAYRAGVEKRLRRAETDWARAETQAAEQVKRRRVVQWAGGLLAAVLLLGIVGTAIGLVRADQRRVQAEQAGEREKARADGEAREKEEKEKQRALAVRNEERANHETQEKEGQRLAAVESERLQKYAYTKMVAVLDVMVSEAAGDSLATQTAVTPEQRKFLTEVLSFYQEFAAATGTDPETRTRTAGAAYRVGMTQSRLGHKHESAAAFVRARDGFAGLAAEFPAVPQYRADLGRSHSNLGLLLADLGEWAEAGHQCRAGLAVRQKLAAEFPAVLQYRADLGRSRLSLGLLLKLTGKRAEAEGEYRTARAVFAGLAAEFPAVPQYRADLATSHNSLGDLLNVTDSLAEAEGEYRAGLAVFSKLGTEFPAVLPYRTGLATSYSQLGAVLADLGKWVEAEDAFRTGLTVRQKLAAEFPAVPQYRTDLATSHTYLGLLYQEQGKHEKSIEQARFSLQADPERAFTHLLLGLSLQQTGDIPGARTALTEAARLDPQFKGRLADLEKQFPPPPVAPPPREKK